MPGGVECGENDEASRVVGDRQQEQKHNGGMGLRARRLEDEPSDHVAERDVGRHWDRPPADQLGIIHLGPDEVDAGRAHHAADRGQNGKSGRLRARQRPAGEHGLPDFFAREEKEESHRDVVDQEVKQVNFVAEHVGVFVVDEVVVRLWV